MTHTPGPWKVMGEDVVLMRDEREVVAWVGDIDGQMTDNAHLIAAAPDMLRALEAVYGESEESDYLTQAQIQVMCRSAIQKARGEE